MTNAPGVITRAQARRLRIPLKRLLSSEYVRLHHDTSIRRQIVTTATRASALLDRLPAGAHISHHTAVSLWGGVAPASGDLHVSMKTREARCRRAGVAAHLVGDGADVTTLARLLVSSPIQAFLDLASHGVSLVDLVVAGDSLVKATGISPAEFVEAAQCWSGRNLRRARRAAGLIREGVDSPMETKLRLLLIFAGLPEPTVNYEVRDRDGRVVRRFDLRYERWRLVIEYDGRQHAFDSDQWHKDLRRREELDNDGLRIIVVTSDGIYGDPLDTLERVRDALIERGAPNIPRRFKVEWTRHFPTRSRVA